MIKSKFGSKIRFNQKEAGSKGCLNQKLVPIKSEFESKKSLDKKYVWIKRRFKSKESLDKK